MVMTMTNTEKKTKTNLFDNFYAILLRHNKKNYLTSTSAVEGKKITVKTELSPPP
jgi:hypothetical protein